MWAKTDEKGGGREERGVERAVCWFRFGWWGLGRDRGEGWFALEELRCFLLDLLLYEAILGFQGT